LNQCYLLCWVWEAIHHCNIKYPDKLCEVDERERIPEVDIIYEVVDDDEVLDD